MAQRQFVLMGNYGSVAVGRRKEEEGFFYQTPSCCTGGEVIVNYFVYYGTHAGT